MRKLVIDCATEACSVALFDDCILVASDFRVLGRGHAEQLVPMIAALPERGKAERILVSLGPGSFTGIRVGLAAARALALAWNAECLGYPSLALVAATNDEWGQIVQGRMEDGAEDVLVCMEGGHGDWYLQPFNFARQPIAACRTMSPAQAVADYRQNIVIGTRAKSFVERRGWGSAFEVLPKASRAGQLPGELLTSTLSPAYGRAPDAKLPGRTG
jgi:tRNA threonylcarbamoyladenosine biosynthesis protein TsaB